MNVLSDLTCVLKGIVIQLTRMSALPYSVDLTYASAQDTCSCLVLSAATRGRLVTLSTGAVYKIWLPGSTVIVMNTVVISSVSTFETLLPPPPSHNARIFFCFVNISEKGRAQLHYLVIFLCIASSPLWHFYVHDRGSVRSAAQQNPDTFIDYYQCYSCNLPIYFPSPILFYFRNQVVFFSTGKQRLFIGQLFFKSAFGT